MLSHFSHVNSLQPHSLPGSYIHGILQAEYWNGSAMDYHALLQGIFLKETRILNKYVYIYINFYIRYMYMGTSLAVHWLQLSASTAVGPCLMPGQGTKIIQAM